MEDSRDIFPHFNEMLKMCRSGIYIGDHYEDYILDVYKRHALWAIPILLFILFALVSSEIDLFVAQATYYNDWIFRDNEPYGFFSTPFFDFIYLWGVLPAQLTFLAATLSLILSRWVERLKRYRTICLVLSLTLAIGSGFITHTVFKEMWGRPRPRQIVNFGGNQSFRPFYEPQLGQSPEPSKSFPSGHSTCGFYFFCIYFLGRRLNKPALAKTGLVISILLGSALSLARIVQGGHFISDIVTAALIMWLTAYFVDYLVYEARFLTRIRKKWCGQNDIAYSSN
jgi:membrane-associated PAP2 superfamily phosphatase